MKPSLILPLKTSVIVCDARKTTQAKAYYLNRSVGIFFSDGLDCLRLLRIRIGPLRLVNGDVLDIVVIIAILQC